VTSEGEKYARTVKVPGDGVPGQLELGLLGSLTTAGDMPESGPKAPDDLKGILLFLVLSGACMTIGRLLERRLVKPTADDSNAHRRDRSWSDGD